MGLCVLKMQSQGAEETVVCYKVAWISPALYQTGTWAWSLNYILIDFIPLFICAMWWYTILVCPIMGVTFFLYRTLVWPVTKRICRSLGQLVDVKTDRYGFIVQVPPLRNTDIFVRLFLWAQWYPIKIGTVLCLFQNCPDRIISVLNYTHCQGHSKHLLNDIHYFY